MIYFDCFPELRGVRFEPIPDFPGYFIGETGVVISARRLTLKTLKYDYNADGYVRVRLFNKTGRYNYFVHRLVAEAFIKKRPGDKIVDHLYPNVENNHVSNLRWCRNMSENLANPNTARKRIANKMSRNARRKRWFEE